MAKRRPPLSPPTPILRGADLRKAVAAQRAKRTRATKPARANLAKANLAKKRQAGDPFKTMHRILEQETRATWSRDRARPIAYWDERWTFKTRSKRVAYEEIEEWRFAWVQNRTIATYLANRSVAVLVVVHDPERDENLTFTAATGRDYDASVAELLEKLSDWAQRYGRDALGDEHSYVKEVVLFLRSRGVHPLWRKVVKGRATAREELKLDPGSDFD